MAKVAASQGRSCRIWLELEPATGQVVPQGFSYHVEWLGPDGEPEFVLKTRENAQQIQEGNRVYLDVHIPKEAPVGLYDPTRFEMRYGLGNHRQVREESVDDVSLPSIEVSAAVNPEVPWPKVKRSG
jgi:hypothetical protein